MSNFWQRTLTGSLFVLSIVLCTIFSGKAYLILLFVANFLCLLEFYELVLPDKRAIEKYLGLIAGSIIVVMFMLVTTGSLNTGWAYHLIPIFGLIIIIKLFENTGREFETLAFQLMGIIYIAFPFSMLADLGYFNSLTYGYALPLGFFILQWSSDTFAYLVGRKMGKRKLFERISPKKTIEGSMGALVLTTVVAYILSIFFTDLPLIDWLVIGILIVIFGTLGDLVESLLKRNLNIKDSGTLLPGHGGFLDRFDGFFLSVPAVYFYLLITQ